MNKVFLSSRSSGSNKGDRFVKNCSLDYSNIKKIPLNSVFLSFLLHGIWFFFFFFFCLSFIKETDFTALCFLKVTDCLEILAWRSFWSNKFPLPCVTMGNAPILTEKSKQMLQHPFHEVPCRRDPVILSLSGKFLDSAWTHAECEPGYWTLLAN